MKLPIIITGILLSIGLIAKAQTPQKTNKVRIQKNEVIDGKTKITDTTFTVDGPVTVESLTKINGEENDPENGKKMVIVTNEVHGDNYKEITLSDELEGNVKETLKIAGVEGEALDIEKVLIIDGKNPSNAKDGMTKIVVIRKIKIAEVSPEDAAKISGVTGVTDGKLAAGQMNFYPNPNDGKFNLAFSLSNKGDTDIKILNAEGKLIYSETLKNFTGTYDKQIDISSEPKGIYFVRIQQGEHSQLKKIVLE